MCKAPILARNVVQATQGSRYGIGISSHGLPVFHLEGEATSERVVCVKNETVLTLLHIPLDLQEKLGIGASAHATFIDTGDNCADEVFLWATGNHVDLHVFVGKATAYVGMMVDPGEIEDAEEEKDICTPAPAYFGA